MGLFDFFKEDKCIFSEDNGTDYPHDCDDCSLDGFCTNDEKELHEKKVNNNGIFKFL